MGDFSGHADLAPSSADRWMNCTASVRASAGVVSEDNEYSLEGTDAHRQLELWLTLGLPPADALLLEHLTVAYDYAIDLEKRGYEVRYEERLTYDADIWGTGDIVAIKGTKLKIVDYKHGYIPVEVEHNSQLQTYALAAERTYGREFVNIELTVIQPRLPHRHGPVRSWTFAENFKLWFANDIHLAKLAIFGDNPKFMAGRWCRYCPIFGNCKTAANHISTLSTGEGLYL